MVIRSKSDIKKLLEDKLSTSAFRKGISAFRYGVTPKGVSDHLPISISISDHQASQQWLSWNLLADEHLYNNFMNISGIDIFKSVILSLIPDGNIYLTKQEDKLFYFLAELAQYLYKNIDAESKSNYITQTSLNNFISLTNQPSQLTRSRSKTSTIEKQNGVEAARKVMVTVLIQEIFIDNGPYRHEFKLMLKHALELAHHILNREGALRWTNRVESLKKMPNLISHINQHDIICLQELTSLEPFQSLLASKHYVAISHCLSESNRHEGDHCAVLYKIDRYELLDSIKSNVQGKKPYVMLKLRDKLTDQEFILASIHHPGGNADFRHQWLADVNRLELDQALPCYIIGDFNHSHDEFLSLDNYDMIYPEQGTAASNDYQNLNKAIDGVLTNRSMNVNYVKLLKHLPLSPPAEPVRFEIRFFKQKSIIDEASSSTEALSYHHALEKQAKSMVLTC